MTEEDLKKLDDVSGRLANLYRAFDGLADNVLSMLTLMEDIGDRLDKLEKKKALFAAPSKEESDIISRLDSVLVIDEDGKHHRFIDYIDREK